LLVANLDAFREDVVGESKKRQEDAIVA